MTIVDDHALRDAVPAPRLAAVGNGRVEAIHIAPASGAPMVGVTSVRAIAGVGLDGDRYGAGTGHWSPDAKVDRHLTLVAGEEIDRLADFFDIHLEPGETRRNITTRGIDLNALVGRQFRVGGVECIGTRLCEPCQYLTDLVGEPILEPLVHRAGLRARILSDGEIAVGDPISVGDEVAAT